MITVNAHRQFDRRFYLGASILAAGLVFWGFAHTYYLKILFGTPELSSRLQIHGAVMSSWVLLFFIQAYLVASHRVRLHRRLGAFGTFIAILVVILGSSTTFNAAAREVGAHSDEATARVVVLGLELVQMALFAIFVAAAILVRRRPDFHKRLMLLATACLLPSAFARIPLNLSFMMSAFVSILVMFDLCAIVCVLIDSLRNHRLHPAFGWGGSLAVGALTLTYFGANSSAWIRFATWLVS